MKGKTLTEMVLTLLMLALLITMNATAIYIRFSPGVSVDGAHYGPFAIDGKGKIYLAWGDDRIHQHDIFFTRSIDWGMTWEEERQIGGINNPVWAVYPAIAADNNDHVYVVWEDWQSGIHVYFTRSSDGGATFETEKRIDNSWMAGLPAIVADNGGHVYVSRHAGGNEIWVDISSDYGENFNVHKRVDGGKRGQTSRIATDGSDKIYVVFTHALVSSNFYFTKSSDSGSTWSAPIRLGDFGEVPGHAWWWYPEISVGNGIVYIAWPHVGNNRVDICLAKSIDFGETFSDPVIVTSLDNFRDWIDLASYGDYVYVSWGEVSLEGYGDACVAVSVDRGATFSEPIQVDAPDADSSVPQLVAHDRSIYCIWSDRGGKDVYFAFAAIGIETTIDIAPDILNLRSKGQWITAYIQLPDEYDPEDIDATTILLNETISPVLDPKYEFVTNSSEYLVDHNGDGLLERMVKFNRTMVSEFILSHCITDDHVTLTITGEVAGIPFSGEATIEVILGAGGSYRRR